MRFVQGIKVIGFLLFLLSFATVGKTKSVKKTKGDLGYRYTWDSETKSGKCLNKNGAEGLNPHFIGPCGDLRNMKLKEYDLNGAALEGANFDGLNLRGIQLNGANLKGIRARGTNFSQAHLNGANLIGADISGSIFDRSELNGARMNHANLSGSTLRDVQLHGTHLIGANLGGTIVDSDLKTAKLKSALVAVGTVLPISWSEAANRGMTGHHIKYRAIATEKKKQ